MEKTLVREGFVRGEGLLFEHGLGGRCLRTFRRPVSGRAMETGFSRKTLRGLSKST
ncbi:MAG: hypothetical protein ACREDF_10605 [Thermoplasmata archaeon]